MTSNLRIGECCYGALVCTHHALARLYPCGLRHPEPNEFRDWDNH